MKMIRKDSCDTFASAENEEASIWEGKFALISDINLTIQGDKDMTFVHIYICKFEILEV